MDQSIFRSYDIRGVYPNELNEDDAYLIGRAIFNYLKPRTVAIGRDARLSAPVIQGALLKAFVDAGCEATDLGMASSDMVSFAAGGLGFDLAISVTASHNPKEWIGMKLTAKGGEAVGGAGEIAEIAALVPSVNLAEAEFGTLLTRDISPEWISHVLTFVDAASFKNYKIVVDAGNGVAGPMVSLLAQHLPVEIVPMYFEPDGTFPNHLPSPIEPENVADLQKRVVETGADLGMAFDGDADRVFLIDEKGGIVTGSEMTAMVADALLTEDPSRIILYNAICGWNVSDVIAKHNARSERTKVGHGYIKKDMKRAGAYFAGEHSGHYFFQKNFNADSGLIAAMLVIGLLSRQDKPLSEFLSEHRKYLQIPETNFKIADGLGLIEKLATHYADGEVDRLDGLTVRYDDWWFNVRLSSNEPLVRLNLEAKDKELLGQKTAELKGLLQAV
jgi:phosphomannomutase